MSATPRPLAVVTGASSGIGLELARQLATHGYDLLIAAEDAELESAARELERLDGASVQSVRVDLAADGGVDVLYERISDAGRPVEALVLNAGIGSSGAFKETDLDHELTLVDLNCRSTVHLAKHVLADMVARDAGRVLFTSSISATIPTAYEAVYGGSKAFVQSLALALRDELKDTGVTVTTLMPGPVDTAFWDRADARDTALGADGGKDDPADVARLGFEAMMNGDERVIAASASSKAQGRLGRFLPDSAKASLHARRAAPGSAGDTDATSSGPPITVKGHSLIDYGLTGVALGGPPLLGLKGAARWIPIGWGLTQGALNALTDQPYAIRRLVSFRNHGRIETVGVPALAGTILATGAYRDRTAAAYFAGMLAALGLVYALTDWDATAPD
jgi:uncharacterized protein